MPQVTRLLAVLGAMAASKSADVISAPNDCLLCPRLCVSRKAVVNGVGPLPADILIVAQNPGAKEESANPPVPLIGWSGQRLAVLCQQAGFSLLDTRRENIVRCRPPKAPKGGDSTPTKAEIEQCAPFLLAVIEECKPRIIITKFTFN